MAVKGKSKYIQQLVGRIGFEGKKNREIVFTFILNSAELLSF